MRLACRFVLCVFDLDGVVWLAGKPIEGSARAVQRLRDAGASVVFVTNNSTPTLEDYVGRLARAGVDAHAGELATSAQAAATLLCAGDRVAVLGGPGLVEAVAGSGAEVVPLDRDPVAVVVGRTADFDFAQLAVASRVIRGGARFIATNTDATFPTPGGLEPGAGALVAFIEVASGQTPEIAGKPNLAMAKLVAGRYGVPDVVIGDSPKTDGAFAKLLGSPFALVLSGVTRREDLPVDPPGDLVSTDAAEAVEAILAGRVAAAVRGEGAGAANEQNASAGG